MVAGIKRLCAVAALLGVLLSLVSLASCTGAEGINPDGARGADAVAPSETEDRDLRILMLGCDRAASLTDSILLLNVTPQTGQVRILQIPRDTYADYTERDYKKLNGAYHTLGADGTREFLGRALGVRITAIRFRIWRLTFLRENSGWTAKKPSSLSAFAQVMQTQIWEGLTRRSCFWKPFCAPVGRSLPRVCRGSA